MFYLVVIFRTSSPGGSIWSNPERTILRRCVGSQVIQKFCNKRQVVWTSKKKKKTESVSWSVCPTLRHQELWLLCPWDSPGKNTTVSCHFFGLRNWIWVSCIAGRFFTIGVWTSKDYPLLKKVICLKVRNLALFYVWEDARLWAHWNHSFDMHLTYLGPISSVFISWVSTGLTTGSGYSLMATRWQVFFSFLSFLRADQLRLEGCC